MAARSGLGNGPLGRRRRRVGLATKKKTGGGEFILLRCDVRQTTRMHPFLHRPFLFDSIRSCFCRRRKDLTLTL